MNLKIIGVFVCMLLIVNTIVCANINKEDFETDNIIKNYSEFRKEICQWGNEYDRIEGDTEEFGENAIRMGQHFLGGDATAFFKIDILEDNYILKDNSLKVGILFCDWGIIGDGPNVYIYNWKDGEYLPLEQDAGDWDQYHWWWYPDYINPPNDFVDNDGVAEIKIWCEDDDDTVLEQVCITYEDIYVVPEPDLNCIGNINHLLVKPGAKIVDSFEVENIGDPGSNLNWEIQSDPNWATFHYDPGSGTNLQPEDGSVIVDLWFYASNEEDSSFSGDIKVINSDNPSDFDYVSVSVSIPRNKASSYLWYHWFLESFPLLERLLTLIREI